MINFISIIRIFNRIIRVAVLILVLGSSNVQAWEWNGSMEHLLMERINTARNNPAEALLLQDLDISELLACHPELTEYMDNGLNAVHQDTRLFKTAAAHAQEMASEGYFSKISLDGSTVDDRYIQASFFANASDEVIGIVLFQNYLSKEKALNALWKGMLENELNCEEQPGTILFRPEFTEIGISIQSGSMYLSGMKFNFYIAVCDFGQDQVSPDEKKSFFVVNQIRSAPDTVEDPIEIIIDPLENDLLPFRFDNALFYTAEKLIDWVVADLNNIDDPIEPLLLEERLKAFGYEASQASETYKVWITIDEKTSDEIRQYFLEQFLTFESELPADQKVILSEIYTEAGLAMLSQKAILDGNEYYIHIMAVVAALPLEIRDKFICTGLLYNSDPPIIDKGAEAEDPDFAGILLQISDLDLETSQFLFTGQSGEFSIELEPGEYILSVPETELLVIQGKNITITNQNIFVVLEYQNSENTMGP